MMLITDPNEPSRRFADERSSRFGRGVWALVVAILMITALAIGYLLGTGDWRGAMHLARSAAQEAAVTARIETAFAWSEEIPASSIDVATQGAIVRLRGTVPSDDVRRLAVAIAENTEGVERVQDQLLVENLCDVGKTERGKE